MQSIMLFNVSLYFYIFETGVYSHVFANAHHEKSFFEIGIIHYGVCTATITRR